MKKIGVGVKEMMALFGGSADEATRKAQRIALVKIMWRRAVEAVYKDSAQLILDHINAVYIMSADDVDDARAAARVINGGTVLVLYSDDSLIRSDLDARQEFLKMKLNEQGERVEVFCIKPSRFDMKKRHPFKQEDQIFPSPLHDAHQALSSTPSYTLSSNEIEQLELRVASIENIEVKEALKKAIAADMQRKKAKKSKNKE